MKTYSSFELYYDTGGHIGPQPDLAMAIELAKRLLRGCRTMSAIEIRPRSINAPIGGYSERNTRSVFVRKSELE